MMPITLAMRLVMSEAPVIDVMSQMTPLWITQALKSETARKRGAVWRLLFLDFQTKL